MFEIPGKLSTALADRYTIERELGRGGMATVYLAQDLKHQRPVAVKVLRPDLAATLGPERFLREIQLAANLNHPHILPLHDSGDADGFLFYVMPYIKSESLRDKIDREGELPIGEAARYLRDVVDALAHAHAEGVVHRDIKPDNVLLSGRHAVVSDFGVAKAVTDAAGQDNLTTAGVTLGTLTYMAPEQAAGDPHIDHRADIYAVGAMAYEILTGRPPFVGTSPQSVLAAHVTQVPDPVTEHRDAIPAPLAHLVMTCLAKKPADRWQTAAELVPLLEALAAPSGGNTPTNAVAVDVPQDRRKTAALHYAGMVAVGMVIVMTAWFVLGRDTDRDAQAVDPDAVAVLPFRVVADESLDYLREGMVDALHAKFTGEGGPRAVDPRTIMQVWHQSGADEESDLSVDASVTLARQVGAGQVLLGGVVKAGSEVTLTGTLYSVPGGASMAEAAVVNVVDSLPGMMDQLVSRLLSLRAGEGDVRSRSLSGSLEAVKAYLEGRRTFREGRPLDAIPYFNQALSHDSSFALAAVFLAEAADAAGNTNISPSTGNRWRRLAWSLRDGLSPRDRARVIAGWGRNYPGWTSLVEQIEDAERAVELAPDDPGTWLLAGNLRFALGLYLVDSAQIRRAVGAFDRALALDSTAPGAVVARGDAALKLGDTVTLRRLQDRWLQVTAEGDRAGFDEWRLALALGDTARLERLSTTLGQTQQELTRVGYETTRRGLPYDTWERALRNFEAATVTNRERLQAMEQRRKIAALQGRMSTAIAYGDSAIAQGFFASYLYAYTIEEALFGTGYDSVAAAHADALERMASDQRLSLDNRTYCMLGIWRAAQGDSARARVVQRRHAQSVREQRLNPACAAALEVMLEPGELASPVPALERLDSLMRVDDHPGFHFGNVVLARMRERRGDPGAALRLMRRQHFTGAEVGVQLAMPFLLREEGRLATMVGDTAGAIDAYQHYLAVRTHPEPALQPEVDRVRSALVVLLGDDPGR